MRTVPLIFISALALLLTQCTVSSPSKRSHNNAFGAWLGWGSDMPKDEEDEDEEEDVKYYLLGAGYKYMVSSYGSLNFQPGIIFGDRFGINLDASIHILLSDLKMGGLVSQLYFGPDAGFSIYSKGKMPEFNPNLGAVIGLSMLFPASKTYPESDLTLEASVDMKHESKISKDKEAMSIGRVLYNVYLF